ncbi:AraC family transcriptional regulator [Henriciella mobilis]|uniref:helix-turn-helix transcriptional regulator n=1 Tax=Henriciella mobilis TaxID=2305467 RepID=UPI000E671632|nr:helix-turn-helix transcriptional regulator [Henriciella mobilis]RIJ14078.1 AraC family transcriptional regulator [Henriciella mobilis]
MSANLTLLAETLDHLHMNNVRYESVDLVDVVDVDCCDDSVFIYIKSGQCVFSSIGGETKNLSAGDIMSVLARTEFKLMLPSGMDDDKGAVITEFGLQEGGVSILIGRETHDANDLIQVLPEYVYIPADDVATDLHRLRSIIRNLESALEDGMPPSYTRRLSELIAIELAMYAGGAAMSGQKARWFEGFSDQKISLAITAMQKTPQRDWTLMELGRLVGLSRSVFAVRFHEIMGIPAGAYLRKLRINYAAELLKNPHKPIPEISLRVGYKSESAFNKAFKRDRGVTPGAFRASLDVEPVESGTIRASN